MIDKEKFFETLGEKFGKREMNAINRAWKAALPAPPPFQNLKMGDIVASSQGLRLVVSMDDDSWAMVALNSFRGNGCPTGRAINARTYSKEELIAYLIDRKYTESGHIGDHIEQQDNILNLDF